MNPGFSIATVSRFTAPLGLCVLVFVVGSAPTASAAAIEIFGPRPAGGTIVDFGAYVFGSDIPIPECAVRHRQSRINTRTD
jgi:hypothetical protein